MSDAEILELLARGLGSIRDDFDKARLLQALFGRRFAEADERLRAMPAYHSGAGDLVTALELNLLQIRQ